jgi:hypothetical protein
MSTLAEIAGALTELHPAGPGRLRGLCPIHPERTASFYVFEHKQRWHCFGCGEGGDDIDFIRRTQGVGYREALKILGRDDPKATAATLRECRRRRAERAQAEWREREVAWTLGNAIRIAHGVLRRVTPAALDDFALLLQWLSTLEHQHDILVNGDAADRAAVVAEFNGIKLFPRAPLFRRDFDYRAWLRGVNMELSNDRRPEGTASNSGRAAASTK